MRRALFLLFGVFATVAVVICISAFLGSRNEAQPTPPPQTSEPQVKEPVVQPVPEPMPQPVPEPEPMPEPDTTVTLEYTWGQPVPQSETVTDDYFKDCAFIGNSLMDGFGLYSGIKDAHVFAYKGITVTDIYEKKKVQLKSGQYGTVLDALKEGSYNKVYIMMGLNELGYRSYESFSKLYEQLIDEVRAVQPNAEVIVLSVLPITKTRSDKDGVYNMKNVLIFRELVRKAAESKQAYYIDLETAIQTSDGFLPEDASKDGVHLVRSYYVKWLEYIKIHTIDMFLEEK